MSWEKILKDEPDENYGRKWEKPNPSGGKPFTFTEGYGFSYGKDSKIANWFKTIEKNFDAMLNDLGVKDISVTDTESGEESTDNVMDVTRGKSPYWTKQIKVHGTTIAAELLKAAVEGYLKQLEKKYMSGGYKVDGKFVVTSPPEIDPDEQEDAEFSEMPNVDSIFTSKEYNAVRDKTLDVIENMLSVIMDTSYLKIRIMADEDTPLDEGEDYDLNPLEELSRDVIDRVNEILGATTDQKIDDVLGEIERELESGFGGEDQDPYNEGERTNESHGNIKLDSATSAIANSIKQQFKSPEGQNSLAKFKAYIFMTFVMKYPYLLRSKSESSVADQPKSIAEQEGIKPAEGYRTDLDDPARQQPNQPKDEYFDAGQPIDPKLFQEGSTEPRKPQAGGERIPEGEFGDEEDSADKRRRRFEDKFASTNQSSKSWMDVLKNTGPTLTTSQGFAPTMHNLRYSCDDCEENCECGN